jgi:predicted deacylase
MNTVTIGNVSADSGEKRFGYLKVEESTTLRTFQYSTIIGPPRQRTVMIPLMVANGTRPGPTFCITAGVHACEYTGIEASIRTYTQVDPGLLKGVLLILPVVNPASFWTMTPYVNIQDGVDISAVYGIDGPTVSYFIAKTLLENVISRADAVLDFHGGDLLEELLSHTEYYKTGDKKLDEKSELLARTFGLDVISESIATSRTGKLALNIPQIVAEVGGCGKLEETCVSVGLTGILNIMKKMSMIEGEPVVPHKQTYWYSKELVYTEKGGLFYPKVKVGDYVSKGEIIAEMRDLQGQAIEQAVAPSAGIVYLRMYNPVKLPGDLLFKLFKN